MPAWQIRKGLPAGIVFSTLPTLGKGASLAGLPWDGMVRALQKCTLLR
jgi:hypothetical protein